MVGEDTKLARRGGHVHLAHRGLVEEGLWEDGRVGVRD
jgi:hypothetical protein